MFARLIEWNRKRREWNEEHERAWAGASTVVEGGLSRFQAQCEAAVSSALSKAGTRLVNRSVEGTGEPYVKAQLAGTDWTLWLYFDGAEVSSQAKTLVRMEAWDAKTPDEFIARFVTSARRAWQPKATLGLTVAYSRPSARLRCRHRARSECCAPPAAEAGVRPAR